MFKELRPESLLEDDDLDDEHSAVVLGDPMAKSGTTPPGDERLALRRVSSFGHPKAAGRAGDEGRSSLYERLVRAGALDEVALDEVHSDDEERFDPRVPLTPLPEAPPPALLSSAGFRDLAEELEPARDSAELLRDSDLDLDLDDELFRSVRPESSPISHRTDPRISPSQLADAAPRALAAPRIAPLPPRMPSATLAEREPSMVLGPGASTRTDATSRLAPIPSTHPLANTTHPVPNSLMPVAHTLPPQRQATSRRTPWWQMIAAAAVLLGLGVAIGRLQQQISTESKATTQPAARQEVDPAQAVPAAANEPPNTENAAALAVVEQREARANPAPAVPQEAEKPRAARSAEPRALGAASRTPKGVEAEPAADETEENEAPASSVRGPAKAAPAQELAGDPNLPAQPSRQAVVAALSAIAPELASCTGDKHGTANVTLTVRGAGVVSHALVTGMFAGTPEGSCIARAVKLARFEPFRDPTVRITYPFEL